MKVTKEGREIELSQEGVQSLINYVDFGDVLSNSWDAAHCEGDLTAEEARKDPLIHLAFQVLGTPEKDQEAWFKDLEKNVRFIQREKKGK